VSLSPRKLSRGIMESPAYVCLSVCLSLCLFVTTITKRQQASCYDDVTSRTGVSSSSSSVVVVVDGQNNYYTTSSSGSCCSCCSRCCCCCCCHISSRLRTVICTHCHTHAHTDRRTSLIHTHADELPQLSGGVGRSYTHTHTHIPLKLLAKTEVNLSSGL